MHWWIYWNAATMELWKKVSHINLYQCLAEVSQTLRSNHHIYDGHIKYDGRIYFLTYDDLRFVRNVS